MFGWNEISFFVFIFCVIFYAVMMLICMKTGKHSNRAAVTEFIGIGLMQGSMIYLISLPYKQFEIQLCQTRFLYPHCCCF